MMFKTYIETYLIKLLYMVELESITFNPVTSWWGFDPREKPW